MNMFAQDAPTLFSTPPIVPDQRPQAKPKGGMFGGVSIDPGAFLAAFAAGLGNPAGMQALRAIHDRRMERQRLQTEEALYQRRRGESLEDWKAQQMFKLEHDQPQYGEFERALIASGVQPGSPQWQQMMARRRDNMLDPIVNTAFGPVLRSAVVPQSLPQTLSDEDFNMGGPAASPPATFP